MLLIRRIEVLQHLWHFVEDLLPLSNGPDEFTCCALVFSFVTEHKPRNKEIESREFEHVVRVNEPFFPWSPALTGKMDQFVWTYIGLQMQCTDKSSHLVYLASLAGGYLSLIFPMAEDLLDDRPTADDHAERHVMKFSLLRLGTLFEDVILPVRNMHMAGSDWSERLYTVAAAGVLYCEVEHVLQGLQSGKLKLLCVR